MCFDEFNKNYLMHQRQIVNAFRNFSLCAIQMKFINVNMRHERGALAAE